MKAVVLLAALIVTVIAVLGLLLSSHSVQHLAEFTAVGFAGVAVFIASSFVPD